MQDQIKIISVPEKIANDIERWVTGERILWCYYNHTLGNHPHEGAGDVDQDVYIIKDLPRFSHYFFPNSRNLEKDKIVLQPLTRWIVKEFLPGYNTIRVMGNMTHPIMGADKLLNIPHMDSDDPMMVTFLYYVNDSDGKTVFFKDKKIYAEVNPVKGTGVLFPSNMMHAGQLPTLNNSRFVINNLFKKANAGLM